MKISSLLAMLLLAALAGTNASALPDMKATIRVSGGNTYDYVVVGMRSDATDVFDNAYDIFAPTGTMNDAYIKATINHPEWYTVKTEFRSDIRSIKELQEWTLSVYTNLPAGTALALVLKDASSVPADYQLNLQDSETGTITDLRSAPGSYITATSPMTKSFKIVAERSASTIPQPPDSGGTDTQPPVDLGSGPKTTVQPEKSSCTVSGVVKDQNGNPLAGVKIRMSNRNVKGRGKTHMTTISGSAGTYRFTNVAPGSYSFTASKKASQLWKYQFAPVTVSVSNADIVANIVGTKMKKRRR